MREDFPITGNTNEQRKIQIDNEQTINLFEFVDVDAKKPTMLVPTGGLTLFDDQTETVGATFGTRGSFIWEVDGAAYFVMGAEIFRMDASLTVISIGTINTAVGLVRITANSTQVIFVDAQNGWIWNGANLVEITDVGFPSNPIDVTFLDGFFVIPVGGTNQWQISDLNDGMSWDATQVASITSHPGTITGVRTLHRRLFIFSQNFIEVWENAGQPIFPFLRNNAALMEFGTVATGSIESSFDILFFLSNSKGGIGPIMMVTGVQAIPVSTQSVDFKISQYTTVSDAVGFTMMNEGIMFYRLNFTSANETWIYNISMSSEQKRRWHNEEMLNGSRHIAQTGFNYKNINYVGAYNAPKLFQMSFAFTTNDTENIKRVRQTRIFANQSYKRIRVDRLELDLIQGFAIANIILNNFGDQTTTDIQPVVFLNISKDGGTTFPTTLSALMGKIGQYDYRTIFRKLGTTHNGKGWVFRFEFYNNLPNGFYILGASWDYEVEPE